MSKVIDVHLSQLRFPSTCAVCGSPASKAYELRRNFTQKHKSCIVKVNVPMCDLHFRSATFSASVEKWIVTFGIIAGILGGLLTPTLLLVRRAESGQGNILDLFAVGILGLGIVLIFWAMISLSLAPLLGTRASKAHHAVRFGRYWPEDQFVRLKFQDEQLADIVQSGYKTLF